MASIPVSESLIKTHQIESYLVTTADNHNNNTEGDHKDMYLLKDVNQQ